MTVKVTEKALETKIRWMKNYGKLNRASEN